MTAVSLEMSDEPKKIPSKNMTDGASPFNMEEYVGIFVAIKNF